MKKINYKGKGEHCINELEKIIEQIEEELHLIISGQVVLNLDIVSNNEVAVCSEEEGKCISQKRVIMGTRKEHCGFKQTDC